MKTLALILILILAALSACASKPSPPPECDGPLVPINVGSPKSGDADAARPRS